MCLTLQKAILKSLRFLKLFITNYDATNTLFMCCVLKCRAITLVVGKGLNRLGTKSVSQSLFQSEGTNIGLSAVIKRN